MLQSLFVLALASYASAAVIEKKKQIVGSVPADPFQTTPQSFTGRMC
jgi:hypothetical protein